MCPLAVSSVWTLTQQKGVLDSEEIALVFQAALVHFLLLFRVPEAGKFIKEKGLFGPKF